MRYSIEPRKRIYVKGYGFMSLARNFSDKYSKSLIDKEIDVSKNWVKINDELRGTYNVNSQIKFKTTMLKSSLCDYSDAYILVKGTITIT